MNEFVSAHVKDGIGTLLLSRPPTNTVTRQMYREIAATAHELGERTDAAAVIVFGGHEIFSAGSDVGEWRTLDADAVTVADRVARHAVAAVAAIPKPTVAAVTGYALGSGVTLALAADWRISGDNVKWGATQILEGLAPTDDDADRMARAIGDSKAKDLTFSGRLALAPEALELGLADELVAPDHVYDAAVSWAQRFVDVPAHALAAAKAAFRP
ncbi:enoyl-CoA hydratase [Mycobacterium antarcticum]|uniref:enoyl-CoA hydratase n=1 Tax=Mycolicibacterium sp. TUM20983 TaxID=3023369 RepID=UPI0023A09801|nr:enoyl-CoA hydratase [Mycolicibacterium sp. TUM20983]GLP76471.1 enoyl-CoA hydratase [Mycolicibacterium sp. TUM20983]